MVLNFNQTDIVIWQFRLLNGCNLVKITKNVYYRQVYSYKFTELPYFSKVFFHTYVVQCKKKKKGVAKSELISRTWFRSYSISLYNHFWETFQPTFIGCLLGNSCNILQDLGTQLLQQVFSSVYLEFHIFIALDTHLFVALFWLPYSKQKLILEIHYLFPFEICNLIFYIKVIIYIYMIINQYYVNVYTFLF